jgi:lyso-ornithine lipid O-acyltransferase
VLPFRSAFFSVCEGPEAPLVQPVSVVYDRLGGMPAGRSSRALFAWYGDMELGPHFWRIGQEQGMRATVLLHKPLDPAAFPSRKALAAHVWGVVAAGAAALRQNRPVGEGPEGFT